MVQRGIMDLIQRSAQPVQPTVSPRDKILENLLSAAGRGYAGVTNVFGGDKAQEQSRLLREALSQGVDLAGTYGYKPGEKINDFSISQAFLEDVLGRTGFAKDTNFIGANPVAYSGGFRFDPNFGSDYYRQYAMGVGEALGISPEEVLKTVSPMALNTFYTGDMGTRKVLGQANFAGDILNALSAKAGLDPQSQAYQQLAQAGQGLESQLGQQLAVESDSSGFFKQVAKDIAANPLLLAGVAGLTGGLGGAALGSALGTSTAIGTGIAGGAAAGGIGGIAKGSFGDIAKGVVGGGLLGGAGGALTQGVGNLINGTNFTNGMLTGEGLLGGFNSNPLGIDYSLVPKQPGFTPGTNTLDLFEGMNFPQQGLSANLPGIMDFGSGLGQGIAPINPVTGIRDIGGIGLGPGIGLPASQPGLLDDIDFGKILDPNVLQGVGGLLGGAGAGAAGSGAGAGSGGGGAGGNYVPVKVDPVTINRQFMNPNLDYENYGYGPEAMFFRG